MAPTPSRYHQMVATPTKPHVNQLKTPQSKHRLNFNLGKPSPNPNSAIKESLPAEHPVEVIGRIRDYPDRKENFISALQINADRQSLRVRTDIGYRDFSLDGVSLSEEEDLDGFYKKFVESRINDVKLGAKCTIMMYGPTGSGKSHTMFGCAKLPGIVYKSLRNILGGDEENDENEQQVGSATFVQVTVLEIYNEEIYDLLSVSNGGFSIGWSKGASSKVKLEVMGKKVKNATFICGTEAGKISKEIQKVEKRRIIRSTLCNERSSRSHCMIILDVPTVGGRLTLVDMAGSENIEQAGQIGFEAKLQTAKINQGNIALKRVVESIANGDSHVPFRDSKLTMLLQDSFEDDKSKILMILCASPDPKELHKTISTFEYGAKAKCIVRGRQTPVKDKGTEDSSSAVILGSRIAAMDQFIYKLQMENKLREKEQNEANKALVKKEEEIAALKAKLALVEGKGSATSEEEINLKVNERTQILKSELERKIQECQKMANDFVEMEKRKMEERMFQQQEEVEILRRRLEEIEYELRLTSDENGSADADGSRFAKRLLEIYADEDPGMEKSMDLDRSTDFDMGKQNVHTSDNSKIQAILSYAHVNNYSEGDPGAFVSNVASKGLSTVFEEEEEGEEEEEEEKEKSEDEEVQKEVIEEKRVCSSRFVDEFNCNVPFEPSPGFKVAVDFPKEEVYLGGTAACGSENSTSVSSMQTRIQNIFALCGNDRELTQKNRASAITNPAQKKFETTDPSSPPRTIEEKNSAGILGAANVLASTKTTTPENKQKLSENHMNKTRSSAVGLTMEEKENFSPLMLLS